MRKINPLLAFLAILCSCKKSEQIPQTGREWIEKSISYHDPENAWTKLKASFVIQDSLPPGRDSRFYEFSLDNSQGKFVYRIAGLHYLVWGDSVQVFEGEIEKERALRMRNYYSYLWGLPMKLMDQETQIEDEVRTENLNGKTYSVVRVPYEKDIWYFYLDPQTYRMEAYKFYQDEPNSKGEIIYLENEVDFQGMKIPQNRTWYRTETPEFLGTDLLLEIKPQ
ncbi:hypothetical protein DFQ04_0738 [Algoriphagus boseongensis]|uniref:Outer membrane lipoprotein-sorting protein n=1 Tax=Algoriphagus boseongensis TaxID=1442587 RepID=A0A4V3D2H3_9BACT|nr:DUF6503 family protein [Algoriphagus boseongensis]TDQ18927.1 hypothetical protein DFQ04_0738 [Algoriphagus boseongensis]